MLDRIRSIAAWVTVPAHAGTPILPDPADWPVVACALAANCPVVTGNRKHSPPRPGVRVMTARQRVEAVRNLERRRRVKPSGVARHAARCHLSGGLYHRRMQHTSSWPAGALFGRALSWLLGWWRIVHLGAMLAVLALSPGTYRRDVRRALARRLVGGTAPLLLGFAVVSSLISVVLIRIVVVTALSYGLSRFALEMVVRVLVLELIPLGAALFVALRYSVPQGVLLARSRVGTGVPALGVDAMRRELLPPVLAAIVAVLGLAAVSGVLALVIAYLQVHGFTPWALGSYTRAVGHVFNPAVALIFVLKTLAFGVAVALVPIASAVHDAPAATSRVGAELRALTRLALLILVIEALSLVGNYF